MGELDEFVVGVDGHVTVTRHREGSTIKCSCAGRIASKGVAAAVSMTQREAYLIAVAIVERIATGNALGVGGDAADGVGAILNRRAYRVDSLDSDIVARLNSAGSLALGGIVSTVVKVVGVIAVADGGAVAGEGRAVVVANPCLTVFKLGRRIKAVGDGERATVPTHETTTTGRAVGGEQLAIEHAACDFQCAAIVLGHESAMGTFTALTAQDVNADATVLDFYRTPHAGNKTGGIRAGCTDSTIHMQVLDGGADGVAEEGVAAVGASVAVKGDGVTTAIERAADVMIVAARHTSHGDVFVQLHGLADEAVVGVIVLQHIAEHAPALGTVDGVLIGSRLLDVGRIGGEGCRHGDVLGGHGEGTVGDGHVAAGIAADQIARIGAAAERDAGSAKAIVLAAEAVVAISANGDVVGNNTDGIDAAGFGLVVLGVSILVLCEEGQAGSVVVVAPCIVCSVGKNIRTLAHNSTLAVERASVARVLNTANGGIDKVLVDTRAKIKPTHESAADTCSANGGAADDVSLERRPVAIEIVAH